MYAKNPIIWQFKYNSYILSFCRFVFFFCFDLPFFFDNCSHAILNATENQQKNLKKNKKNAHKHTYTFLSVNKTCCASILEFRWFQIKKKCIAEKVDLWKISRNAQKLQLFAKSQKKMQKTKKLKQKNEKQKLKKA